MIIKLKCPQCNTESDFDTFKLLGVPVTLFKSFGRKITAKTGTVTINCEHCNANFKVPKQMIMNVISEQGEEE